MGVFTQGFKISTSTAAMMGLLACAAVGRGETLFQDSFDSELYGDGAALVVGPNQLPDGVWSVKNQEQGTVITTAEMSLSAPRSLALVCPQKGDLAQVVARFTKSGQEMPTSEAITVKFAFILPEPQTDIVIAVRNPADATLVTIRMRSDGMAKVFFADQPANLGSIAANTWYQMVITLPPNPGSEGSGDYTVALFDGKDRSKINSVSGRLGDAKGSAEYRYLTIYQENTRGVSQTSYWDDFLVESTP